MNDETLTPTELLVERLLGRCDVIIEILSSEHELVIVTFQQYTDKLCNDLDGYLGLTITDTDYHWFDPAFNCIICEVL